MNAIKFNVADAMRNITLNITITGVNVMKIRLKIGMALMFMAARIIGCGVKVDLK